MNPFHQDAEVDIAAVSGSLRVTIVPRPRWLPLLLEAAAIIAFAMLSFRAPAGMHLLERIVTLAFGIGSVVGWFAQLSGWTEVIEFDEKRLTIRKESFGWERVSRYPLEECSDLQAQDITGRPHGLQCVGALV